MKHLLLIGTAALLLSGCATPAEIPADPNPSGFWFGFWNGLTFVFSFIGSLFNENIAVYDASNKGGLYDFGFLIGLSTAFGSSVSAAKS